MKYKVNIHRPVAPSSTPAAGLTLSLSLSNIELNIVEVDPAEFEGAVLAVLEGRGRVALVRSYLEHLRGGCSRDEYSLAVGRLLNSAILKASPLSREHALTLFRLALPATAYPLSLPALTLENPLAHKLLLCYIVQQKDWRAAIGLSQPLDATADLAHFLAQAPLADRACALVL
jgi:hypothetical protein